MIEQLLPVAGADGRSGVRERRTRAVGCVGAAAIIAGSTFLFAQHTARVPDISEGARMYRSTCALCHGLDGSKVTGVNLGSGQYLHASSDEDLARIIREGITDTAMPANRFSDEELANIIAYLHSMRAVDGRAATGEAARGQAIFEGKGQCLTCHQVGTAGGKSGPSLTGIGLLRRPDELRLSVVEPETEVLFAYRTFQGTLRDGSTIRGRVLNEDTFTVQIIDATRRLMSIVKADLQNHQFLKESPMPSYRNKLTESELADLVAYLSSLTHFLNN